LKKGILRDYGAISKKSRGLRDFLAIFYETFDFQRAVTKVLLEVHNSCILLSLDKNIPFMYFKHIRMLVGQHFINHHGEPPFFLVDNGGFFPYGGI
jgi:hypothetical protein